MLEMATVVATMVVAAAHVYDCVKSARTARYCSSWLSEEFEKMIANSRQRINVAVASKSPVKSLPMR